MNGRIHFCTLVFLFFLVGLRGHPLSQSYWFIEISDGHLRSTIVVPLGDVAEISGLGESRRDGLQQKRLLLQRFLEDHFELVLRSEEFDLRLAEAEDVRISEDQVVLESSLTFHEEPELLRIGSILPQKTKHEHEVYCTITTPGGSENVVLSRAVPARKVAIGNLQVPFFGVAVFSGFKALLTSPAAVFFLILLFAGLFLREFPPALVTLLVSASLALLASWFWFAPSGGDLLLSLLMSWIAFEYLVSGRRPATVLLASGLGGLLIVFALESRIETQPALVAVWLGIGLMICLIAVTACVLGTLCLKKGPIKAAFFLLAFISGLFLFTWQLLD